METDLKLAPAPDQAAPPRPTLVRPRSRGLIPALPTLWPSMLAERERSGVLPPPLGDPATRYWYFARNAVWHGARALGLSGGEVLMPAYFHGVEVDALLDAGVHLRWVKVDRAMQLDLADLERQRTKATRAVYAIHYAGFPQDVFALRRFCDKHGLLLIEDCALALLSRLGGQPLGTFGDAAIWCFYKALPVPNGGALTMKAPGASGIRRPHEAPLTTAAAHAASSLLANAELRLGAPARLARTLLRRVTSLARRRGLPHVATGTQRFSRAAVDLAISPLSLHLARSLDHGAIVARRRRNYLHLTERLGSAAPPVTGPLDDGVCPLFYPVAVVGKRHVQETLAARGIETVDFWRTPHPEGPTGRRYAVAEELRRTVLEVPCHQDLGIADMDRIADELLKALGRPGSAARGSAEVPHS